MLKTRGYKYCDKIQWQGMLPIQYIWSNPMGANFYSETHNFAFAIPATVPTGVSISWKITNHCKHEFSVSSNPPRDPLRGRRPSFMYEFKIETSANTRGVTLSSLRFCARPKAELSFVLWEGCSPPNVCWHKRGVSFQWVLVTFNSIQNITFFEFVSEFDRNLIWLRS